MYIWIPAISRAFKAYQVFFSFRFVVSYEESGQDYKGFAISSIDFPVNTWFKMTLTCSEAHPANCKAYFDNTEVGTFITSEATNYRINVNTMLVIGRLWPTCSTEHYMNVEIAEISLWTPELTFTQIQEL